MRRRQFFTTTLSAALVASCSPQAEKAPKSQEAQTKGPKPLVVGMELSTPPFEMQGRDGLPDGTSVRLAEALAAKLGRPLKLEIVAFPGLIAALRTNRIDAILSSMTDTPERRVNIDFSDAYCKIGLALLVGSKSPVQTAADLAAPGRKIVVRLKTTAEALARERFPQASIETVDSESAALLEVLSGKCDAFIYDQLSVLRFHEAHPEQTRAILAPLKVDNWAIALRQGDADLKAQINGFLAEFRKAGGFDKLSTQYLAKEKAALAAQGVPFIFE